MPEETTESLRRSVHLSWGARTHAGLVREQNEDQFVAEFPVFLVADGMGGHVHGDIASGIVADEFRALAERRGISSDDVSEAIRQSHRTIRRAGGRGRGSAGMGSTVVVAAMVEVAGRPAWVIANVGDCRAYRWMDGELEQVSRDHSVVQDLLSSGEITAEQARVHPHRHVVTRAVGIDAEVVADFVIRDPLGGERLLLCSDGLYGALSDGALRAALAGLGAQEVADALIAEVLLGDARDNMTAVVIDTESVETPLVDATTGPVPAHREGDPRP
jgi:serine/threonine protein phosphatase PrpC